MDKLPISRLELSKQERNFVHSEMKAIGVEIPYEMTERSKGEIYIDKHLGSQLLDIKLSLIWLYFNLYSCQSEANNNNNKEVKPMNEESPEKKGKKNPKI